MPSEDLIDVDLPTESGILSRTRAWREERALGLDAVGDLWHRQRAGGLRVRERTVRECGTMAAAVGWCADCGRVHVQARRCGDRHVCPACASWAGKKTFARGVPAIERMLRDARREWSARGRVATQRPRVRLLTLTTRDTGDLVRDRTTLSTAWARHRAWLDRRANPRAARKLGLPRAKLRFVLVWEITPGTRGVGHVHAHVVTVMGWYDYGDARDAWIGQTGGESSQYDVRASTHGHDAALQASHAARYLAKYIAKGGDVETDLGADLAAAWWVASYGRRALSASRGAWLHRWAHCGDCGSVAMEWRPATGDLERAVAEARAPPVPWAALADIPPYALADLAGYVGPA